MNSEPEVLIGSQYVPGVLPLISAARQTIDIIIYELRLRPTQQTHQVSVLMRALQDAASRGVRVRAFVGSEAIRLALKPLGITARVLYADKTVHAKMMLLDDCVAVVGSHNYTQSAFQRNIEISLIVKFASVDNPLSRFFKNIWGI